MYPTSDPRLIIRACSANTALEPGDERYFDLKDLRQETSVVDELALALQQQLEENHFHRCLLSGHRGSGKSTELLQLKEWADQNGWVCLWVDVETFVGKTQLEFSDLYLLAAQQVAKQMDDLGRPLPTSKIDQVVNWFADITTKDSQNVKSEISLETKAGIGGSVLSLIKLIANFGAGVAASSEHQLEVRNTFRRAPDQLIDYTNELLKTANEQLQTSDEVNLRRPNGLLLIFDNLDRYSVEAIESVLTQSATLMSHLKCHAVYTIPVELRCRANNVIQDEFTGDAILPMPALRERAQTWASSVQESSFTENAVAVFQGLLEKRINVETLFELPADAVLLVKMSGGCVRDLMHLVTTAHQCSGNRKTPLSEQKITTDGVKKAIRKTRADRSEGLLEDDYKRLVEIAQRSPKAQNMDDTALRFLSQRRVLQYADASGRWLDIHPLLVETEGFTRLRNSIGV